MEWYGLRGSILCRRGEPLLATVLTTLEEWCDFDSEIVVTPHELGERLEISFSGEMSASGVQTIEETLAGLAQITLRGARLHRNWNDQLDYYWVGTDAQIAATKQRWHLRQAKLRCDQLDDRHQRRLLTYLRRSHDRRKADTPL